MNATYALPSFTEPSIVQLTHAVPHDIGHGSRLPSLG